MKRLMLIALGFICASVLTVTATDGGKQKKELTAEQKTVTKEMVAKYDTNKDGKLDRKESTKISADDQEKMKKAGLSGQREKKVKKEKKPQPFPAAKLPTAEAVALLPVPRWERQ